MKNYGEISNKFQQDVLKNRKKYPRNVYLAVKRNQSDLKKQNTDEFPYYFDDEYGNRVCYFVENLKHVKGKWSGNYIELEPWQVFMTHTLFGWLRSGIEFRRFRRAIIMLPRKSGKSLWAAAVGLYMLCADGENGAEIYCGANGLKQAQYIYQPARQMVLNNSNLKSAFNILPNKETIYAQITNSTFEAVIKNVRDGSSPHCAIVDELHEAENDNMLEAFNTGMGAREQPLLLITSTAGVNQLSPCYEEQKKMEKILDGTIKDDKVFGIIYNKDDKDSWKSWKTWIKCNPNYGVSVYHDYLRQQYEDALNYPAKRNILRTKHLNEWRSAGSAWIDMTKLRACKDETLNPKDFAGEECYIGIDLASKLDLCSIVKVIPKDNKYYIFTHNFLPEETVSRPENLHYQQWVEMGYVVETPGVHTDYARLEQQILADIKRYSVREIMYDPFQATYLIQRLEEMLENSGVDIVEFNQSATKVNEPLKEFEGAYLSGEIVYGDDPVFEWCCNNAVIKDINNKLWTITKETRVNKIDTLMATIMAFARARRETEESVYESRGLLVI